MNRTITAGEVWKSVGLVGGGKCVSSNLALGSIDGRSPSASSWDRFFVPDNFGGVCSAIVIWATVHFGWIERRWSSNGSDWMKKSVLASTGSSECVNTPNEQVQSHIRLEVLYTRTFWSRDGGQAVYVKIGWSNRSSQELWRWTRSRRVSKSRNEDLLACLTKSACKYTEYSVAFK